MDIQKLDIKKPYLNRDFDESTLMTQASRFTKNTKLNLV